MSEQPTSKRISELTPTLVLNDADIVPVSQLDKSLEHGAFKTTGGAISDLRSHIGFKNAVVSEDEGIGVTASGQVFHVYNSTQTSVIEYRNVNGKAVATGNSFLTPKATEEIRDSIVYPLNSASFANDAYTATCAIDGSYLYKNNRVVRLVVPSSNLTRTPTLAINNGGARAIRAWNGGNLTPNDLVGMQDLFWHAGSSQWRVIDNAQNDRRFYISGYQPGIVTSDTSSPNIISITIPGMLSEKTAIYFEPVVTNTGPVSVIITDFTGYSVTRTVLQGPNSPLSGGELPFAQPALIQFRGPPANNFKIIASGNLRTDFLNLKGKVEAIEANIGDPLISVRETLIDNPFGKITFLPNGIKVLEKRQVIMTGCGSSIGVAAGSSNPTLYAPLNQLVDQVSQQLLNYGSIEVINDNQSIPTQSIPQFSAQLDNSPYHRSDVVLIIAGMNDAPVGGFNSGGTYPGNLQRLINLINKCYARGAIPILCTSPHHDVTKVVYTLPNNVASAYPIRMFNMSAAFVFSSVNKTITHPYFSVAGYGGNILKAGDKLLVTTGLNAGVYTISGISEDRTVISTLEPIPSSDSATVTITHVQADQELVLEPPPSKSIITRDWTGNGKRVPGDFRFGQLNNGMRSVQRQTGCFLLDLATPFMQGVEEHGWSGLYSAQNFNHFNDLGYQIIGKTIREFGNYLADQIFSHKYFGL